MAAVLLLVPFIVALPAPQAQSPTSCTVAPLDIGIVIDRSGSMAGDRLAAAKQGATDLVLGLSGIDQSGLVSYDTTATLDASVSFDHAATVAAIDTLQAGATTNTGDGIATSHADILSAARPQARQIMILLTDGFSNAGPDPVAAAAAAKGDGIEIYAIGLGAGVNEAELRAIASEPVEQHFYNPITTDELLAVFDDIFLIIKAAESAAAEAYGLWASGTTVNGGNITVNKVNQQFYPPGGEDSVVEQSIPLLDLSISVGAIRSVAAGDASGGLASAHAVSRIEGLEVSHGATTLLRVDVLNVEVLAMADGGSADAVEGQVELVGVTVAGQTLADPVSPTTQTFSVGPLSVSIALKEQVAESAGTSAALTVRGVHLFVTDASFGQKAEIVIAHAFAGARCGAPAYEAPGSPPDELATIIPPTAHVSDLIIPKP